MVCQNCFHKLKATEMKCDCYGNTKRLDKNWMTSQIRKLIKERGTRCRKWLSNPKKVIYKEEYVTMRNLVTKLPVPFHVLCLLLDYGAV